jgi:anti-sigma factor RsiW
MSRTIHEHLRDWLVASANGSLAAEERAELARHLADCPRCGKQACDPELVEDLQRVMERHRQIPAGLEDRVLGRVAEGITSRRLSQTPRSQRHVRLAIRICLALFVASLLAIRTLDLRWSLGSGWAGRMWATVSQFVLRQPNYATGELGPEKQGLLASCHQWAANWIGAVLWVVLLLLVCQFVLEAWRVRRRASPA